MCLDSPGHNCRYLIKINSLINNNRPSTWYWHQNFINFSEHIAENENIRDSHMENCIHGKIKFSLKHFTCIFLNFTKWLALWFLHGILWQLMEKRETFDIRLKIENLIETRYAANRHRIEWFICVDRYAKIEHFTHYILNRNKNCAVTESMPFYCQITLVIQASS